MLLVTNQTILVTGAASPDLPLRVLNLLAQQDVAFDEVTILRDGDHFRLSVTCALLTGGKSEMIAAKIGSMVLVESVQLQALPQTEKDTVRGEVPAGKTA